jgi:hypothetical protein
MQQKERKREGEGESKSKNVTLNIFHTFVLLGIVIRRASKIVCMFQQNVFFDFFSFSALLKKGI